MNKKQLLIKYLRHLSQKFGFSAKVQFFIFGIASTAWFLIRVIPKPSRAGYPCVRAAAPVASAFVLYLLSLASSLVFFKKFIKHMKNKEVPLAAVFLTIGLASSVVSLIHNNYYATASETPLETANVPIGIAKGIYPGRVVWVYDSSATNKNCPNTYGDAYFMDTNTDQSEVDKMLEEALKKLTGQTALSGAWDAIFKYHNQTRGKGNIGYTSNENIFIKINATSTWYENINSSFERINNGYYAISETSPQVVLAVLHQLVYNVGVPEEMIYIGDPMKHIYQDNYTKWHNEFPNVHYLDHSSTSMGREKVRKNTTALIKYSDRGTVLHEGSWSNSKDGAPIYQDTLYAIFENMEYMINIPNLKAHERAGVSMFGKNHFGSHTRDDAKHLHGGLVSPTASEALRNTYGLYRVQVDLMSHKLLGKKNLFYLMDALYCSDMSTSRPSKWKIQPFNNDWTSSIFLSQDPVAIESVGFDFLYAQYDGTNGLSNNPHLGAVDDYLHQLADSTQWPAGIVYDPENDGVSIGFSQGVHEHWNNATDKKYSRNLGTGMGIELLQDFMPAQPTPVTGVLVNPTSLALTTGGTSTLSATVSPANATDKSVSWSSDNTSVATVNNSGMVTAVAAGNATITATTTDGGKTAACTVTVENTAPATAIYVDLGPNDGINGNITSSPDLNGNYWNNLTNTSISAGTVNLVDDKNSSTGAFINITSGFSSNGIQNGGLLSPDAGLLGSFAINTATQDYFYTTSSSSFTVGGLDKTKSYVFYLFGSRNSEEKRTTTYTLLGANNYSGTLQTSGVNLGGIGYHGNTQTILTSGNIMPDDNGQISVTVNKTEGSFGYLGAMKIEKVESAGVTPVTGISLSPTSLALTTGGTSTLSATVSPANATDKSVSWSSDNTSVATINNSGMVTAVAAGNATITATTTDGGKTATCTVTVKALANLALHKTAISSSDEDEGLTANFATDGDHGSRWGSAFSSPEWIYVDLGAMFNVTRVKLFWEAAYATSYKVQVSSDASSWTDVYSTNTGDGDTDDLSITASGTRYVRMYGTMRSTEYGYSIYEFEVYGDTADAQAPTAPNGLNSPSQTPTAISLAWEASTDNVGVTGYDIYKDGAYAASATTTSCSIVSLVAGTAYTFTIKAKDAAGNYSVASNALTVSTLTVPVTGVTLNPQSLALTTGGTYTLTTTISPSNATNQSLSWSSGNMGVATVNNSGLVTAIGAGTATITVTTADGGKKDTCTVTVTVPVTGVMMSPQSLSLKAGGTSTLTATISPSNATDQSVNWTSGNTTVATVNSNGLVTAVAAGSTTITVTTADGGKTDSCAITITVPVTSVALSSTSLSLTPGETSTLTPTLFPSDATDKSVSWSSDNTSVATVNASGMVTAVSTGTANIIVTTQDGSKTDTCTVDISIPVTGITLSPASLLTTPGETSTLIAAVFPSNATNKTISWSSGNTEVATIDASGIVTSVSLGTTTIMATTLDGNKKDSCIVTVTDTIPVTGLTLFPASLSLTPGETSTLTATISPANATNKTLSWTSGNAEVATIDANGILTAVGGGTTTITVATENGAQMASCTIIVTIPVTGITLSSSSLSLTTGQTYGLTSAISPANASNQAITWSSDNSGVAKVNNSGIVTAIAEGTATITVATADGGKTASCTVTVTVAVTDVSLSSASLLMYLGRTSTLTATVSPANATNKAVYWSSSDTTVAKVNSSGIITAITEGTATITVTTADGRETASCSVTVSATIPVTDVEINTSFLVLATCQTSRLTAAISPANATNTLVSWISDNTSVATVDSKGVVKAISTGIANITVTTQDGSKTASCKVSVSAQTITGIESGVSGTISCKNTSVTLSTISDSSYTNYKWSGPGNYSSTAKGPTVSVPGIYTLTANDTVNNCTVTAITNVLQNMLKPNSWASSNGTLSCGTKTVSLKATTSSPHTVVTWDGQNIGQNPVTMEWPGQYYVTTTDTVNGCSKRDYVTVNQHITYSPTQFYNNNFSAYANETAADNSTNGWYLDRTNIPNLAPVYGQNTTPHYFAVYSRRLTAQQLGGEGIWYSKVMDVSGKPNFQIGINMATEGTLTSNDYVKLFYKLDGGPEIAWDSKTGAFSYDFRSPLLNANTVQIVVKIYSSVKGGSTVSNHYLLQYQLYVQDCGTSLGVYTSASGDLNCATPSVTLYANSSHSGATYTWSGPNGFSSTEQYPVVSVPGTYTVTASMPATANPGLTSSTATGSVTVLQNVTVPGAFIGVPDTITSQNKYVILSGSSATSGVYYKWEGPDNFVSDQQNPPVTTTGAYKLTVINPVNGCYSFANVNVAQNIFKSGLAKGREKFNERQEQPVLNIYPNPTGDMLFLKASGVNTINSIKILDIGGATISILSAENGPSLNVSMLKSGIYILIVETEQYIFRKMFIKQ